jgi:hypothetical protein
MAVDCKCFSRNVDVKNVETVMGLVEDVGADLALIVTTEGFSEGAKRRAKAARGSHPRRRPIRRPGGLGAGRRVVQGLH